MVEIIRKPLKQKPTSPSPPKAEKELINESKILKTWISNKIKVDIHLVTKQTLTGEIVWFDTYHLGLKIDDGKEIMLPKHSILYYEPTE